MNEEGARYATGKRIPGVDFSQLFDPAGDSCIEVPLERTQVRYFRDGKKLAVELEGERETIPLAEVRGEVEALDCTADGTVCGDACEPGAACGQYAAYLLRHKKDVVLVLRVERTGEERAMFLKTNDATLAAARSRLLNDAGLKRHRQQKWREAEELFDLALAADSNNRPARYNLACAYARQGMAEASVQHLQRLVGQPKLREKIAKDPDFAPVRQTAIFKSFLEQLAAAPSGAAKP
jgi:tetratricopeptide (TPR) repeat protein